MLPPPPPPPPQKRRKTTTQQTNNQSMAPDNELKSRAFVLLLLTFRSFFQFHLTMSCLQNLFSFRLPLKHLEKYFGKYKYGILGKHNAQPVRVQFNAVIFAINLSYHTYRINRWLLVPLYITKTIGQFQQGNSTSMRSTCYKTTLILYTEWVQCFVANLYTRTNAK